MPSTLAAQQLQPQTHSKKIRHTTYTKSGDIFESANNSKYEVIHNDFPAYQHSTIYPYAVKKPINIGSHMYQVQNT